MFDNINILDNYWFFRLKEYFFSVYQNTLFDLTLFCLLIMLIFLLRNIYMKSSIRRARANLPLVIGGFFKSTIRIANVFNKYRDRVCLRWTLKIVSILNAGKLLCFNDVVNRKINKTFRCFHAINHLRFIQSIQDRWARRT